MSLPKPPSGGKPSDPCMPYISEPTVWMMCQLLEDQKAKAKKGDPSQPPKKEPEPPKPSPPKETPPPAPKKEE